MNTNKYFLEIPNQEFNRKNLQIYEKAFNHNGLYTNPLINQEKVIEDNPFLQWLDGQYKFNCGVITTPPNTLYNFHRDVSRGVCINVLLDHENSFTLFSNKVFDDNNSHYADLTELKYKQNKFYLFNNQIPHAVFNMEGNRSIFSIEFDLNKQKLSYPILKQKIKKWITSTIDT